MLDPGELLSLARELGGDPAVDPPDESHLRRAVSTAYYALFHWVTRAAADRFIGADHRASAGYAAFYRGFNHGEMKTVCKDLGATILKDKYRRLFGRDQLSAEARDFMTAFRALQEARHLADYDPMTTFPPTTTRGLIDAAEVAITAFEATDLIEKTDILALLMVKARD